MYYVYLWVLAPEHSGHPVNWVIRMLQARNWCLVYTSRHRAPFAHYRIVLPRSIFFIWCMHVHYIICDEGRVLRLATRPMPPTWIVDTGYGNPRIRQRIDFTSRYSPRPWGAPMTMAPTWIVNKWGFRLIPLRGSCRDNTQHIYHWGFNRYSVYIWSIFDRFSIDFR